MIVARPRRIFHSSSFRRLGDIERAVAARNTLLWIVLRAALSPFLMLAGQNPLTLHLQAALIVALTAGVLARLDMHRLHEDLFLANLGTSRMTTTLLCFLPPLVGEITIGALT